MGLSRDQRVGGVLNDVAWLTLGERLRVLWALRPTNRATVEYDATVRWHDDPDNTVSTRYHYRPISLWTGK